MSTARPYRLKRALDLVVLALVAIPAALLGAACAIGVRLTSRGPVLFHQPRVGMGGATFDCLKFRTMVDGNNPLIPETSRITTVGKVLRRFSFDELPQLINVARGDMSIVGPRPMLEFQAERCNSTQAGRFAVRPGLTGWAQINGRNALSWPERIELDLDYVARQSLFFDIKVLFYTAPAVVMGGGVEGHQTDDPFVLAPEDPKGQADA